MSNEYIMRVKEEDALIVRNLLKTITSMFDDSNSNEAKAFKNFISEIDSEEETQKLIEKEE